MVLRVLHLTGSPVSDFFADLSRLYAADCLEATADPGRYDMHVAYVSPDCSWRFPPALDDAAIAAAPSLTLAEAVARISGLDIDVVVPQMFCRPGMTSYRALVDVLGIPLVGNTAEVMALTADKARAKAVVAAAGVRTPAWEIVRSGERPSMAPPVVVKPVDADNSLGVTLVRDPGGYDDAVAAALDHAGAALVERYVELGREVRCGIVVRDGDLVCLPLEEYAVDADRKPIRGYDDKIRRVDGGLGLVAKDASYAWTVDLDDPVTNAVWDLARQAHLALGARHYSLVDVRIDPDGTPWFLEAGLYNSFARTSVVATMAAAAGIDVRDLFALSLREALSAQAGGA